MSEITRVPLQPIGKGALGKLWLGVMAAALAAGGIAWAAKPPMVNVATLTAGEGPSPTLDDVVIVNYKGTLADGKVFDQGQAPFPLKGVIPGFTMALQQMQKGGKYKVQIPSELGYGEKGIGPIPPNADLTFDVEVMAIMNAEQFQMMQQMQAMQQMQGARPGGQPGDRPGDRREELRAGPPPQGR